MMPMTMTMMIHCEINATIQLPMMTTPKTPPHHHHPTSCHTLNANMKPVMTLTSPMTMAATNHEKWSSTVNLVDGQQPSFQINFNALAHEIAHSCAARFNPLIYTTPLPTQMTITTMMTMMTMMTKAMAMMTPPPSIDMASTCPTDSDKMNNP